MFHKYPHTSSVPINYPEDLNNINPLEVVAYRAVNTMSRELALFDPDLLVRPWPYPFHEKKPTPEERSQNWRLVVFYGYRSQIASDGLAWAKRGGIEEEDTKIPKEVQQLIALKAKAQTWFTGPGSDLIQNACRWRGNRETSVGSPSNNANSKTFL